MATKETPKENAPEPNAPAKKSPTANPQDDPVKKPAAKKKSVAKKKAAPKKKAVPKRKAAPKKATPRPTPRRVMDPGSKLEETDAVPADTSETPVTAAEEPQPDTSKEHGSTKRFRILPWVSLIVLIAIAAYFLTGPLAIRNRSNTPTSPPPTAQEEGRHSLSSTDVSRDSSGDSVDKGDEPAITAHGEPHSRAAESEFHAAASGHSDAVDQSPTEHYPATEQEAQAGPEHSEERPAAELAEAHSPQDLPPSASIDSSATKPGDSMSETNPAAAVATDGIDTPSGEPKDSPIGVGVSAHDSTAQDSLRSNERASSAAHQSQKSISESVESTAAVQPHAGDTQSAVKSPVTDKAGNEFAGGAQTPPMTDQAKASENSESATDVAIASGEDSALTQSDAPIAGNPLTRFGPRYRSRQLYRQMRRYPRTRGYYTPYYSRYYYPYNYPWPSRYPYGPRPMPSRIDPRSPTNQ